jgi:hypothetical protein
MSIVLSEKYIYFLAIMSLLHFSFICFIIFLVASISSVNATKRTFEQASETDHGSSSQVPPNQVNQSANNPPAFGEPLPSHLENPLKFAEAYPPSHQSPNNPPAFGEPLSHLANPLSGAYCKQIFGYK